jgi:hypothetical protein
MNKESNLRIHNITAKAALKLENKALVLKVLKKRETFWKTNEQRNKIKNSQHYS